MAKEEWRKPETPEVADRIAELVDLDDPPLRCEVGGAPLCARGLRDEEHEQSSSAATRSGSTEGRGRARDAAAR